MFSFFRRKKKQPEAEVKPVEEAPKQPETKAEPEAAKKESSPVATAAIAPKPEAVSPAKPATPPLPQAKKPETGREEYDELPTFTLLPFGDSGLVFDDEEEEEAKAAKKAAKAAKEKKPAKNATPKKATAKKADKTEAPKPKAATKTKSEAKAPTKAKEEVKETPKPAAEEEAKEKLVDSKPPKETPTAKPDKDAAEVAKSAEVMEDAEQTAAEEVKQEDKQKAESTAESTRKTASKKGWFSRLKDGLSKSSRQLSDGLSALVTKRKLDDDTVEQLEELLITADMGAATATAIAANIAKNRYDKEISEEELREALAEEITEILTPIAQPLTFQAEAKPHILLMVGVNGNGKTTTIGKLSQQFKQAGQSVMLCAADTFRAAAVEQLQVWGKRNDVPVITGELEADAASVAYRALEQAKEAKSDWLLIDTAGRLQNKANLMAELEKIIRVLKKIDPEAPHSVVQVLDATTGQNAISQVEIFQKLVGVNGLIVTKLDGSARAGVVVALAQKFKLPIHALGVGEQIDDLKPFNAQDFARNLVDPS
jgi:fused signal recognition particle receptor